MAGSTELMKIIKGLEGAWLTRDSTELDPFVVTFIGRSNAGKTELMQALARLGDIQFDSTPNAAPTTEVRVWKATRKHRNRRVPARLLFIDIPGEFIFNGFSNACKLLSGQANADDANESTEFMIKNRELINKAWNEGDFIKDQDSEPYREFRSLTCPRLEKDYNLLVNPNNENGNAVSAALAMANAVYIVIDSEALLAPPKQQFGVPFEGGIESFDNDFLRSATFGLSRLSKVCKKLKFREKLDWIRFLQQVDDLEVSEARPDLLHQLVSGHPRLVSAPNDRAGEMQPTPVVVALTKADKLIRAHVNPTGFKPQLGSGPVSPAETTNLERMEEKNGGLVSQVLNNLEYFFSGYQRTRDIWKVIDTFFANRRFEFLSSLWIDDEGRPTKSVSRNVHETFKWIESRVIAPHWFAKELKNMNFLSVDYAARTLMSRLLNDPKATGLPKQ